MSSPLLPAHFRTLELFASLDSICPLSMAKAQHSPVKNWVFTLNNPTELLDFDAMDNVRYLIYSEEVGENGTYHFQGYIQLYEKKRLSFLTELIPRARFAEQQAKNNEDARDYCAKITDPTYIDGPYEYGYFEGQGARSDLYDCTVMIKSGATMSQIFDKHPVDVVRYSKGLQFSINLLAKKKQRSSFEGLTVVVGETGWGKSHWCQQEFPDAYWLTRPQGKGQNAFFDLYEGESHLVMDEFYGWLPYDFLLRLCDKYKLQLPVKGSFAVCQITYVAITSNKHVWEWYKFPIPALERRISKVIVFTGIRQCTIFPTYEQYKQKYFRDTINVVNLIR